MSQAWMEAPQRLLSQRVARSLSSFPFLEAWAAGQWDWDLWVCARTCWVFSGWPYLYPLLLACWAPVRGWVVPARAGVPPNHHHSRCLDQGQCLDLWMVEEVYHRLLPGWPHPLTQHHVCQFASHRRVLLPYRHPRYWEARTRCLRPHPQPQIAGVASVVAMAWAAFAQPVAALAGPQSHRLVSIRCLASALDVSSVMGYSSLLRLSPLPHLRQCQRLRLLRWGRPSLRRQRSLFCLVCWAVALQVWADLTDSYCRL